ncbi:hypothetical protein FDENT_7190 [Fusarium denticulatum]|uniref:Uncharacterized protein n=1 Tax=Fusarium denticulatum TaxID=48507 RepID=A0A8H5U9U9_9HYPO|nr:hypothetical protein FDENT_7190 [Fusarium denticulatum]
MVHGKAHTSAFGSSPIYLKELILQNCLASAESQVCDFQVVTTFDPNDGWHAFVIKKEDGRRTIYLEKKASRLERVLQQLHDASANLVHQYVTGNGYDVPPIIHRQNLKSTHKHRIGNNKENLPLPTRKSSDQNYSSGLKDYIVKALVGLDRHKVDALPDTGAKRNFVSQQLVDQLGLVPEVRVKERFRLPTGATVESSGTVIVPFTFLGESDDYLLNCCILTKCTQDLILCQAFLKSTGTLTKFTRRITKSLRNFTSRLRVNLIEDDTCCLQGSFDDIPSIALADTGCDAMLISADFARRHSLQIDKGFEHRRTIEYADGSLDTTTGIVYDSTWQFSSSWDGIPCNFYVLDDLKADIILSSHFIFEHEVFSQFEGDIIDTSLMPDRDFGDIHNIRLIISHYSSALKRLEASSIVDMNSPGSFSPEAIKAERVRRDLIRDAINALPSEQQDQARIDERNRQEIWDGYRKRHFQRKGFIAPTQQSLAVRKQRWWEKGPAWRRFVRGAT